MGVIMRGNKNTEVLLQMLILLSISLFLMYLLVTNKINYYVHPRYRLGVWVCGIMLFLFGIKLTAELKKGRHNSNCKKYMVYFLPLVLAILFPVAEGGNADKVMAKPANTLVEGANNKSNQIGAATSDSITGNTLEESSLDDYDYLFNEDGTTKEPQDKSLKYTGDMVNGAIPISEDYFASWYYDLFDYLPDFKGKRYQFLAQVYSMEGLGDNEFLAGRYIMVCCATDLTGYGIVCKSDMRKDLKEDDWILVTATIDEYDYEGTIIPFLADPVIEKAEAPADEYVYYNFY